MNEWINERMSERMNEWHKRTVNIYGKLAVVVAKIHFKKCHDIVFVIMGFLYFTTYFTLITIIWLSDIMFMYISTWI